MTRACFVVTAGSLWLSMSCGRGTAIDPSSMDPLAGRDGGARDGGTRDGGARDGGSEPGDPDGVPSDASTPAPRDAGERDAGSDAQVPEGDDGDWQPPATVALAARPPMGWNSWNRYGCGVSEAIVRSAADALVSSGMRDAGYTYVNIDDCWQTTRDGDGAIVADPNTFPGGIAALADYVHARGLKLGIYSDRGTQTCAGRPGSQGHESKDAETYAAWGVDFVKYDNCNANLDAETQYRAMQSALLATGRPMVFSVCAWAFAEYMPTVGQLWRTTDDIADNWGSVLSIVDKNAFYAAYARPGAFNDPDMLEVGNGGMTESEYRAHFSLWAMMAAPLIAGNDLTTMTQATKDILTNAEVIAVDQDAWGYQGYRVQSDDGLEVWTRPLEGVGERAVLFFNRTGSEATFRVPLRELGLSPGPARARDLWRHADLALVTDTLVASVPSHDVVMLRVRGAEPAPPVSAAYVSDLTFTYAANGWGPVERDRSVNDWYDHDGRTLTIAGQTYTKGLGVHGGSLVRIRLGEKCTRFRATVGLDDETGNRGSVVFRVLVDGAVRYDSAVVRGGTALPVDIDLTGGGELKLEVTNGGDGGDNDHADWAMARLDCAP